MSFTLSNSLGQILSKYSEFEFFGAPKFILFLGFPVVKDRLYAFYNRQAAAAPAKSGTGTQSGVVRPVWVLPEADIKMKSGKSVRSQPVQVMDTI